ncbi:MAG: TetR/AcrR family transcriptional regulator [Sulfitobacter sp.]
MRTTRLTLDDWLTAGFDALRSSGQNALAAEPLARQLGTTKGSFYWHFKDVPTFHASLIASWHDTAMAHMVTLLGRDGAADQRLRSFGNDVLRDPVEARMRIWAQTNQDLAEMMRTVDAERLAYLTELLRQLGLGNPDFARALLAALVGLPQTSPDDPTQQMATFDILVDTVLALSQ